MTGKELIFWSKGNVGVVQGRRDAEEYNVTRTQDEMIHNIKNNTKQKITTRT